MTKTTTLPFTPVSISSLDASISSLKNKIKEREEIHALYFKLNNKLLESYYKRKIMDKVKTQSDTFHNFNKKVA